MLGGQTAGLERAASSKAAKAAQCQAHRPGMGRSFKTLFTIAASRRYDPAMLVFIVLALAAATPQQATVTAPERQARAMALIRRAAALRFAEIEAQSPHMLRNSTIRSREGSGQPARLIEFE